MYQLVHKLISSWFFQNKKTGSITNAHRTMALEKKVNDGIINRQSLPELDLWKRRLGRTLSRQWNQSSTPSCSYCYTTLNSTKKITKSTILNLASNLSYWVVLVCFIYIPMKWASTLLNFQLLGIMSFQWRSLKDLFLTSSIQNKS